MRYATEAELIAIYTNIADGVGNHGGFLTSFALAFVKADTFNRTILRSAAQELMNKYKLYDPRYLDTQEANHGGRAG